MPTCHFKVKCASCNTSIEVSVDDKLQMEGSNYNWIEDDEDPRFNKIMCNACYNKYQLLQLERKRERSWWNQFYTYLSNELKARYLFRKVEKNQELHKAYLDALSGSSYIVPADQSSIIDRTLSCIYPQGWSYYPGDICQHGVYVGGCGVDWMCFDCEMGYPSYLEENYPKSKKLVDIVAKIIFGY